MTVQIGPVGVVSDASQAEAICRDGLFTLCKVDGLVLPADIADVILMWARSRSSGADDQVLGETVSVGGGLVSVRGLDGLGLDRDSAVQVIRLTERALPKLCHVQVALGGHSLSYSASQGAARAFAAALEHGNVTIDGGALEGDRPMPCERLWRP